jgi:hypothetical protein
MSKTFRRDLFSGFLLILVLLSMVLVVGLSFATNTISARDCWYECGSYGSCTYSGGLPGYKVWLCCEIWPECHYQGCWPQSPC